MPTTYDITRPRTYPPEWYHYPAAGDIPETIIDAVFGAARGQYQTDLLYGRQCWSGADLAGKARRYGGRYADSRSNLVGRINQALPSGWHALTAATFDADVARYVTVMFIVDTTPDPEFGEPTIYRW